MHAGKTLSELRLHIRHFLHSPNDEQCVLCKVVSYWNLTYCIQAQLLSLNHDPWSSWRAPQAMRSLARLKPSCHAPHPGYAQQGVVVFIEETVWKGKNSQGGRDSEG